MTPEEISKLSDQELNELIAVKRGVCVHDLHDYAKDNRYNHGDYTEWRCRKCKKMFAGLHWHRGKMIEDLPDYAGSWTWAGELLNEMPLQTKLINYEDEGNGRMFWTCTVTNLVNLRVVAHSSAATPQRSTAEAWYLMECEK